MKKKIFRCLVLFVLVGVSLILGLAAIGAVAQAAGLVDDTVSADNLYSKYPLMNYRLDFYVDNSWGWLPWNWKDGIGKSVMYGIYCITNFIWIVGLYLSNATGYVVAQAYKLDIINDMADAIGQNMQIIAGVNEHGFQSSGYYVGFLLILILILGVYVAYVGLLKREVSKAVSALMNFLLIFILSAAFIANAPAYIKKINEFSNDVSTATLDIGTKIIMPNSSSKGQDSVDLIRDCLFSIQVKQPWLLLQFGNSDESAVGKSRADKLLSTSPKDNDGEDREKIVKEEIEKNNNSNLTITEVVARLGMVVFLFIFNIGVSMFVFFLAGYMILTQILFIVYAMFLPVCFIFSMVPTYNGNVKKAIEKLFNVIMMRAGITLVVTIAFSISTMFYNMTTDYPYFMVAFLQIITFAGIAYKLNDLLSMFGLNGNDGLQVGRRLTREPRMFLRRRFRRAERKIERSIGERLSSGTKRPSSRRTNTSGIQSRDMNNVSSKSQEISRKSMHRNNASHATDIQNHIQNEDRNRTDMNRASSKKTTGEKLGNKIGAVADTGNRVKDNAKQLKEKIKDAPDNAKHKVYERKAKIRDNVSGFKQGIKDEQVNRKMTREKQRKEYQQNMEMKRENLKQEKERRNNKRDNVQRKYSGLDSVTFTQEKRENRDSRKGERDK